MSILIFQPDEQSILYPSNLADQTLLVLPNSGLSFTPQHIFGWFNMRDQVGQPIIFQRRMGCQMGQIADANRVSTEIARSPFILWSIPDSSTRLKMIG